MYANIITQDINNELPKTLVFNEVYYPAPNESIYQMAGWRTVSITDLPPAGNLVDKYTVIDIDGINCHLVISIMHPIPPLPPTDPVILAARQSYRDTTRQFCSLASIPVTDKLDTPQVQLAIQSAGTGSLALPLTQLAFALYVQIGDLRRLDGDDAWDRI